MEEREKWTGTMSRRRNALLYKDTDYEDDRQAEERKSYDSRSSRHDPRSSRERHHSSSMEHQRSSSRDHPSDE